MNKRSKKNVLFLSYSLYNNTDKDKRNREKEKKGKEKKKLRGTGHTKSHETGRLRHTDDSIRINSNLNNSIPNHKLLPAAIVVVLVFSLCWEIPEIKIRSGQLTRRSLGEAL